MTNLNEAKRNNRKLEITDCLLEAFFTGFVIGRDYSSKQDEGESPKKAALLKIENELAERVMAIFEN